MAMVLLAGVVHCDTVPRCPSDDIHSLSALRSGHLRFNGKFQDSVDQYLAIQIARSCACQLHISYLISMLMGELILKSS
jgi:hypothetical protein